MPGYRKAGEIPPIKTGGPLNYAHLNLGVLRQLLLTSSGKPDVQRGVIAELAKQRPLVRANELIQVLVDMINLPHLYSEDVTQSIVEVLATDPYPEATEAMLEQLPKIARTAGDRKLRHTRGVRDYFYQALVTRSRDTDQPIWRAVPARYKGEDLVNIMSDPAAERIFPMLDPMHWIDRLPRQERKRALWGVVTSASVGYGFKAIGLLIGGRSQGNGSQ